MPVPSILAVLVRGAILAPQPALLAVQSLAVLLMLAHPSPAVAFRYPEYAAYAARTKRLIFCLF